MKLIDLLVQELPRLGGWPTCDNYFVHNSILCGIFHSQGYPPYAFRALKGDEVVYESQYEAALAKSQQQAWSGEGFPPVGCECEYSWAGEDYKKGIVRYISKHTVIVETEADFTGDTESAYSPSDLNFRPIRTEAERKRDASTHAMASAPKPCGHAIYGICCEIYDAIAAGKIPGVKLE